MSGKVGIRMPTGSPASAFLSTHAPETPSLESPARRPEPAVLPPPRPAPPMAREEPSASASSAVAATSAPRVAGTPKPAKEPAVRFQVFLPLRLAKLVDAEVERRKASGRRGRGKSDYTAIFRELVERHLR